MPISIPADASPALQKALREIEQRLKTLEAGGEATAGAVTSAQVKQLGDRLAILEAGDQAGPQWQEMVGDGPQHRRGYTPDTYPAAGLGSERVLRADGIFERALDGLVQAVPESCRGAHATRVVEVLADLMVASSLSADTAHFRQVIASRGLIGAPGAWLTKSGAFSHNSSGNYLKVTFDTANEDNDGICDIANSRLVCRTAGIYFLQGHIRFPTNATGIRSLAINLNDVAIGAETQLQANTVATFLTSFPIVAMLRLAVGDYVDLQAYQNSGGTLTCAAAGLFFGIQGLRP